MLQYYLKKIIRQLLTFNKILPQLENNFYLPEEKIVQYQNEELKKLIIHCYRNVPYYTDLFKKLHLTPEDIQTKEDLLKLPYLTKEDVRKNEDKLLAKNKLKLLANKVGTSGTTGTPLKLVRDYTSINFENAFLWRFYRHCGDNGLKRITLRGTVIIPSEQNEPPFWNYNPSCQELVMSSYHLSKKNIFSYINKINEFKPDILYAYPSTANLLASLYNNFNETYTFKAIFTSSESLSEEQRNFIEKTFNTKIFDWYGQAERVCAIAQCSKGTYHIVEDYAITEFIETDEGLELVGTPLFNYIMPLIRYKTGDIVELKSIKCPCHSKFQTVSKIIGRKNQYYYFYTQDGAQILTFDHIPRGVENIVETQFIQENINELIINLVPTEKFSEANEAQMRQNVIDRLGPSVKILINKTDKIPRGKNGKFENVINRIK